MDRARNAAAEDYPAPDLSNLPEGAVTVDLDTGMEVDSEDDLEQLHGLQEAADAVEYRHTDDEDPPTAGRTPD